MKRLLVIYRIRLLAAVLAMSLATPAAAVLHAQAIALVEPGDPAYTDIDRLVELGLIDSVIVGQRPYSRGEIARLLRNVRDRLDRGGVNETLDERRVELERSGGAALARLERRFGDEADDRLTHYPLFSLVDGAALMFTSTNADRRAFPAPYSRPVEALIDPLAEPRLAQPAPRGNTTDLELSQRIVPASWLGFYGRERIEYHAPQDTSVGRLRGVRGELLIASMRLKYRNAALSVGRMPLAWAQAENDGLFFASDAPALDMISLQNDEPKVPAGPFRFLGPTKGTLVLAGLGPSTVRSNSRLLAYKVSIQPTPTLELGGTFFNHFGGAGGRPSSALNRFIDFVPFLDLFRRHNYTDTSREFDVDSDKLLGADGRLRIPRLAGMTIAGEVLIDDFDIHSIQRMLTGYGSSQVRLIFPYVGSADVSLRVGAKHMGTITYTHGELTGGIASRGRLLGEELGPDAKEFNSQLRWTPGGGAALFTLDAREQIYSNATYELQYTDASQVQTRYIKTSSTPDEKRHVLIGALVLRPDADLSFTFRLGGQVVENWNFAGYSRTDYVAGIALRLRQ